MPLLGADVALSMLKTFRVVWIGGQPGAFKTALAFRLGYALLEKGFCRYLVSNTRSVWRDDPNKVELKGGVLVDAVMILDEGGMFLKTGRDADSFISFLRKMNIVLIIPSVMPPTGRVRYLSIQRLMTLRTIGIPALIYNMQLDYGNVHESFKFVWWRPEEIFGVYDTSGAPSDDAGLDQYVNEWVASLKANTKTIVRKSRSTAESFKISGFDEPRGSQDSGGSVRTEFQEMDNFGRAADIIAESAEQISDAFSLHGSKIARSARRKR